MGKLLSWARRSNEDVSQPTSVAAAANSSPGSSPPQTTLPPPASLARSAFPCPPHGCKAICGARPRMEDAYTAVPFLLEVPISSSAHQPELLPVRIAGQVRSASGCLPDDLPSSLPRHANSLPVQLPVRSSTEVHADGAPPPAERSASASQQPPQMMSALHFFGVFDGHGGAEAALLCARTLHERLAEALAPSGTPPDHPTVEQSSNSYSSTSTAVSVRSASDADKAGTPAEAAQSAAADAAAVAAAAVNSIAAEDAHEGSGHSHGSSMDMDDQPSTPAPRSKPVRREAVTISAFEQAFTDAFSKVDEEFGRAKDASQVGTTAVVALVGDRQLYVGNCGDSRAVLCRAGLAFPLTDDHKAAREDETARVQAAGGEVMWWNGERVMGVLAVSRAIGDHYLRPFVIAQPEVTILTRSDEDDLLLLASDGLWDVLSNQEACSLAQRCLKRAQQRGASRQTAARVAASVLTRAAIDQGSSDNVTVVVVDLSRAKPDGAVKAESFGEGESSSPPATEAEAEARLTRSEELHACHQTNSRPKMMRAGSVVAGPPGGSPTDRAAAAAVAAVEAAAPKATTNVKAGQLQCS